MRSEAIAARKMRDELHSKHGRRCSMCGRSELEIKLHIDCIVPQGDEHHRKKGWACRMRFYRKQDAIGNIRLLCEECNARKGATDDKAYHQRMRLLVEEAGVAEQEVCSVEIEEVPF